MKRKDDLIRIDIPHKQAQEFRGRYRPIVRRILEISAVGSSFDLEALLLSVYLQGVIDGSNPQVQERLKENDPRQETLD